MYFPIEFKFTNCFWYLVKYNKQKSCWESNKLFTNDYNLNIPDDKVKDWSEWGPINGAVSNNSDIEDNKSEGQLESIDIKIPTQEEERSERQLEKLAESIPTLMSQNNGLRLDSTWVFWNSWCRAWYHSVCFDGLRLASLRSSCSLDQTTTCCLSLSQSGDKYSG